MKAQARMLFTAWLALSATVGAMPCRAEIVVVVSRENPLSTLPRDHLEDLFLGRSDRFPGGEPAVPLDLSKRLPPYSAFYERYLGRTPPQMRAHWSRLIFTGRGRPPRSLASSREMADAVAADPRALGYLPVSEIDDRLRVVVVE